ncbi:SpaA isopeptide-forming pilin-related protein [Bifidobacterium eulemuris]|uniref:Cell surface protein fimafimbrial subunit n=1 Tax=Bifidobacterium eulemuris TaxID=1765219 RepID=A0A261GCX2_9BIFI|nr:SpaA isopeptide-forming pilin-related protein [Bifidobacterium eulemuris]OZG69278.1 cell surface protein fimafimbrial subunit [Bifidobacterium eulemuris]QOL31217.1 LPXTG cell wall anchor domain-containing protein [Bifidobacterium eulemuris]
MKGSLFKKGLAALAAFAVGAAGMAMATTTANAAPSFDSTTITLRASDARAFQIAGDNGKPSGAVRSFTALKIADYVRTPDANGTAVTLQTVAGDVKNSIVAVLTAADQSVVTGVKYDGEVSDGDPLVWLTKQSNADYRVLVNKIQDTLSTQASDPEKVELSGTDLEITLGRAGVYLIWDVTNSATQSFMDDTNGRVDVSKISTVLAGTSISGADPEVTGNSTGIVPIVDVKQTITTTALGSFQFQKVKADGTTALQGAKFKVQKKTSDPDTYTYQNYASASGLWSDATDEKTATEFESDNSGRVELLNIPAGTYKIVETTVPAGFMQNVNPAFIVTININGSQMSYEANGSGEYAGLVSGTGSPGSITSDLKVKNVTNITQLPLTGGMGVALFTVVGVVLAGAAVVVYARSRNAKRALGV